MGVVFRQSIKTTIVTFAGALLGALTVYLSTRFIPEQEYGFSRTLLSQAIVASQVTLIGMHTTLFIFVNKYDVLDERRKVLLSISVLVPLLATLMAAIPYFTLKDYYLTLYSTTDSKYMDKFFIWLPIYTLLWAVMTVLENYLLSHLKVAMSNFIKEIILRGCNILLVVFYALSWLDFWWFMILSVLIHIVPIVLMLRVCNSIEDFGFSVKWNVFSKAEYKKIIDFAISHLFVNVSVILLIYVDQLMLGVLDKQGLVSVAVYSVAIYVLSIFQIPIRAMSSSIAPIFTKAMEDNDENSLDRLFAVSAINVLIVICGMSVLILANVQNLAGILNKSYSAVVVLVPILILGRFIDSMTGFNTEVLTISKYYRFNFILTILLLLVVIFFNYLLIPKYGVYGAAWANTIGFASYNLAKFLFVWKKMNLQPFRKESFLAIMSVIPAATAGYFIPQIANPIADAIVRSTTMVLLLIVSIYYLKPSNEFNQMIKNIKEKKRLY